MGIDVVLHCSAMMIAGVALAAVNTQDDSLTAANLTGAKKKRRDNPSGLSFDLLCFDLPG
jgi:hypothetical protein